MTTRRIPWPGVNPQVRAAIVRYVESFGVDRGRDLLHEFGVTKARDLPLSAVDAFLARVDSDIDSKIGDRTIDPDGFQSYVNRLTELHNRFLASVRSARQERDIARRKSEKLHRNMQKRESEAYREGLRVTGRNLHTLLEKEEIMSRALRTRLRSYESRRKFVHLAWTLVTVAVALITYMECTP